MGHLDQRCDHSLDNETIVHSTKKIIQQNGHNKHFY
jgi:hypothetical protein